MTITTKVICLSLFSVLLIACDKKDANKVDSDKNVESKFQSNPDFGGTETVSREAEGIGSTPELAVVAALQSASAQVNGVRVNSQMQNIRTSLNLTINGGSAGSASSESFVQQVISSSNGAILGYEIISQVEVDKIDEEVVKRVKASDGGYTYNASASSSASYSGSSSANASASSGNASANANSSYSGSASANESANLNVERGATSYSDNSSYKKMRSYWKVKVKADIAKYKAPKENGRPKIVVSLPKTLTSTYPVGDSNVSSDEVAKAVRSRLSDMLTQTKRFIVLDREFGADLQAEIDHINSGNVRIEDSARVGQQLATDLILIPTIERFEYPKSVRNLRMSDRQVVSYSGGGRITLKLLNATTGEVVMSDSFDHSLTSTGPSTLPRVVDGKGMAAAMMDSMTARMGSAIISEIFPVTVISLSGDQVVLSQGGDSLSVGDRWEAVALGKELIDPQTGNSLGRSEEQCCVIRVDRVSKQTSYGTIENSQINLGGASFKPGLIQLSKKLKSSSELPTTNSTSVNNVTSKSSTNVSSSTKIEQKPKPKVDKVSPKPNQKSEASSDDENW